MADLILYGTAGCHLCEEAEVLLRLALASTADEVSVDRIDIAGSDELLARYGTSIPVLRDRRGAELNWPFDAEALECFLRSTLATDSLSSH